MKTISIVDIEALMEQFRRAGWQEMHLRVGGTELFLSADGSARSAVGARSSEPDVAPTRTKRLPDDAPASGFTVLAPSLGSFHRAPRAGAPVFAELGAHVSAGSTLCAIEILKHCTPLRSDVAGIVREIYVGDGALVEFEQPLFLIEPHA